MKAIIFDIKEFAINDGPGVRTTVFLKGCPLSCIWCHNPEGLFVKKELWLNKSACRKCGICQKECNHEDCKEFDRCIHACPNGALRAVGQEWAAEDLAKRLLRDASLYQSTGGGITVSGGEPLLQYEFTAELLKLCRGVHRNLETSGFAPEAHFQKVLQECDLVYFDLKLADAAAHKTFCGQDNAPIHRNLTLLKESGKPHLIRVPLIPGITDTKENLAGIAALAGNSEVELLPYNEMAGAKYEAVGRTFPTELQGLKPNCNIDLSPFQNAHIRA